jgi:hypothetical protein
MKLTRMHDPGKVYGNCMMTCYANVLGYDVDMCPRIEMLFESKKPKGFWWNCVLLWWEFHWYELKHVTSHAQAMKLADGGYYFAIGKSPRYEGKHEVIFLDGEMVFDPHPDDTGILTLDSFEVPLRIKEFKKEEAHASEYIHQEESIHMFSHLCD